MIKVNIKFIICVEEWRVSVNSVSPKPYQKFSPKRSLVLQTGHSSRDPNV
jgi:hypothetical protein